MQTYLDACSVFEAELADHIPVVKTSVAGTRLVGRVTVGVHLRDCIGVTNHCVLPDVLSCCREQEWLVDAKHHHRSR